MIKPIAAALFVVLVATGCAAPTTQPVSQATPSSSPSETPTLTPTPTPTGPPVDPDLLGTIDFVVQPVGSHAQLAVSMKVYRPVAASSPAGSVIRHIFDTKCTTAQPVAAQPRPSAKVEDTMWFSRTEWTIARVAGTPRWPKSKVFYAANLSPWSYTSGSTLTQERAEQYYAKTKHPGHYCQFPSTMDISIAGTAVQYTADYGKSMWGEQTERDRFVFQDWGGLAYPAAPISNVRFVTCKSALTDAGKALVANGPQSSKYPFVDLTTIPKKKYSYIFCGFGANFWK